MCVARRGNFRSTVLAQRRVCAGHYALSLRVEGFPPSRAGQFVQVRCGALEPLRASAERDWPERSWPRLSEPELAGRQGLLRRPFSLAGRRDGPDGSAELEVMYQVVGVGTAWLSQRAAGDAVEVLGPLGNGFSPVAGRPAAVFVGGGIGIPPLLYLAETLAGGPKVAFAGARTRAMLPLTVASTAPPSQAGWPGACVSEFTLRGTDAVVATDDGSLGVGGYVHEPFARWLDTQNADALAVYACGPEPMLRAVADVCLRKDVPCQVSVERHMACGLGTCQSCAIKLRTDAGGGWRFGLVCADGPVFEAASLAW